ncbi:PEBP-like protein [Exidia glandulosa HHB12029]|uniref:PEBP-like protein n=1 Tax=Exidia glandulosa HHB12029 TaxID=1314781 RepID=A0A165LBC0_EXIGL|nr:PEBP-like protein [Exidia glandulosa HHB12029]
MRAILALTVCLASVVRGKDTLASVKKAFYDSKLVPDVVPSFEPEVLLSVTYNGVPFEIGDFLDPDDTKNPPSFGINTTDSSYANVSFLLAILDPDAPKPQKPENAPFRHLLAPDYKSAAPHRGAYVFSNSSAALTEYTEPDPPEGSDPHRYAVLLYKQSQEGVEAPSDFDASDRKNFNITQFVYDVRKKTELALVGGTFFYVVKPDEDVRAELQHVLKGV